MDAGKLNTRVTIESLSTSTDSYGQPVEMWSTFATLWAWVRMPSGVSVAERVEAGREIAPVAISVRVRYRSDIKPAMRLVCGADTWHINRVVEDVAGREYVDLVCTEVH